MKKLEHMVTYCDFPKLEGYHGPVFRLRLNDGTEVDIFNESEMPKYSCEVIRIYNQAAVDRKPDARASSFGTGYSPAKPIAS